MKTIGLDARAIRRCLRDYSHTILQQWIDITLAARERHGERFFRRSAAAYFIDNVKNAAKGTRTPPDWWHDLQRQERQSKSARQSKPKKQHTTAIDHDDAKSLTNILYQQFRDLGQSEDSARTNAQRFAETCEQSASPESQAAILQLLK